MTAQVYKNILLIIFEGNTTNSVEFNSSTSPNNIQNIRINFRKQRQISKSIIKL